LNLPKEWGHPVKDDNDFSYSAGERPPSEESSDGVAGQSLGFQPDHLHLLLNAGMGVMVPLVTEDIENVERKGEFPHRRRPREGQKSPVN
jgi:hypothetical protein